MRYNNSAVLAQIREMHIDGMSYRAIAQKLTAAGVEGKRWSHSTIQYFVRRYKDAKEGGDR